MSNDALERVDRLEGELGALRAMLVSFIAATSNGGDEVKERALQLAREHAAQAEQGDTAYQREARHLWGLIAAIDVVTCE